MRSDSLFLYRKAMRSSNYKFLKEVFSILIDDELYSEADRLTERMILMTDNSPQGRFRLVMETGNEQL